MSTDYGHTHSLTSATNPVPAVNTVYTQGTGITNTGYGVNNYTTSGYSCSCGTYVQYGTCHTCYPTPNYYPNYIPSQQIIVYPQPAFSTHDYMLAQQVKSIDDRLDSLEEKVEKLLDLLLNKQDEEVRGHSQGGCSDSDSEGGTGTSLELSVTVGGRQPRGDFHWPPRD